MHACCDTYPHLSHHWLLHGSLVVSRVLAANCLDKAPSSFQLPSAFMTAIHVLLQTIPIFFTLFHNVCNKLALPEACTAHANISIILAYTSWLAIWTASGPCPSS